MNHWGQLTQSGVTQMYDYGYIGNKDHYGCHTAPYYNLAGNLTSYTLIM